MELALLLWIAALNLCYASIWWRHTSFVYLVLELSVWDNSLSLKLRFYIICDNLIPCLHFLAFISSNIRGWSSISANWWRFSGISSDNSRELDSTTSYILAGTFTINLLVAIPPHPEESTKSLVFISVRGSSPPTPPQVLRTKCPRISRLKAAMCISKCIIRERLRVFESVVF